MTFKIDLGTHVYNLPCLGLKLVHYATASVLPPRGTPGLDETRDYEASQNSKEWLDQTPELNFHAQFRIGPHVGSSSFFSQIGEVLCHSRIWIDLGLDVVFKSCNQVTESDHSTTIRLSFALRKKIKSMDTSKLLRIPAGMRGIRDTVPPEGIPTAYLSAIDLYFEYIACEQDMVGFETKERGFGDSRSFPLEPGIEKNKPDETLDESICFDIENPNLEGLGTEEKTEISALKRGPREWERDSINQTSNTCSMPPPVSLPLEKTLHSLFSNSFRNIIVGIPPEAKKKTTTPENKGMMPLSQLCPSVFSLGYREALGQRSQFIPSIATSISSILQGTKNPTLQRRASIIASSTESTESDPLSAPLKKDTVRIALKQALWRSAQKQLCDPEKSRRLGPLDSPSFDRNHLALKKNILFAAPIHEETDIIETDSEDNYDSDYYLGTETNSSEISESEDEAEKTNSLLSLMEDYADLSVDMFTTSSKDKNHSESAKMTEEMHIDSGTESSIDIYMHMDVEGQGQGHADEISIPPPASHLSVKSPHSDNEMLNSDCTEYDMELVDSFSQSTAGTSVFPDQEELIIDDDFDDLLCDLT